MKIARIFRSGNGQAIRLPKDYRFNGDEVEIYRRGNEVILRERRRGLGRAFELLAGLPEDFMSASVPSGHRKMRGHKHDRRTS